MIIKELRLNLDERARLLYALDTTLELHKRVICIVCEVSGYWSGGKL